jgi:hypothetical protein
MRTLALVCLLLPLSACPMIKFDQKPGGPGSPSPPQISVSAVNLVEYPAPTLIARFLCPSLAPGYICAVLGGRPSLAELKFTFDVQLDVANPNNIPLPVVEALAAFTAFPHPPTSGDSGANLGAVCLSLCETGNSCPKPADACSTRGPQIRTIDDFQTAATGFLFAVATGQASLDNLKIRTIAPNGHVKVDFQLALNAPMLLDLVARLGGSMLDSIKQGKTPRIAIPYLVEGTVWVDVQGFGKIAAGFGPYQNTWNIQ